MKFGKFSFKVHVMTKRSKLRIDPYLNVKVRQHGCNGTYVKQIRAKNRKNTRAQTQSTEKCLTLITHLFVIQPTKEQL